MHWLGYNDAVSLSNEVKTRIFQPIANFENFEIPLYFVSLPASQPAIRPGSARCRAPEISHDKGNGGKCCSEDDLPTAPWRFLFSFPCSSLFL